MSWQKSWQNFKLDPNVPLPMKLFHPLLSVALLITFKNQPSASKYDVFDKKHTNNVKMKTDFNKMTIK